MASTIRKRTSTVCQDPDPKERQKREARLAWLRGFYWLGKLPAATGVVDGEQAAVLEYAVHAMKAKGLYRASAPPNHVADDIRALLPEARTGG